MLTAFSSQRMKGLRHRHDSKDSKQVATTADTVCVIDTSAHGTKLMSMTRRGHRATREKRKRPEEVGKVLNS